MNVRQAVVASGAALAAIIGIGCAEPGNPSQDVVTYIRFRVINAVSVSITYNSGYGNKFFDKINPPSDSWTEKAKKGSTASISAKPWERGGRGRISVVIDYGTDKNLICHDTNFDKITEAASCSGKIK